MTDPNRSKLTLFARAATVLYTLAICVLSLMPGDDVPLANISDKYRHAAAYAGFAILLACSSLQPRWRAVPLAFVVASVVGIGMEIIQPYFHRTRDVYDAMANSIGAAIGCAVVLAVIAIGQKRSPEAVNT